ncbi:hypothetical protein F2Q69_00053920 [Brassica cretica]|uniref:Uncharacterized protein n=1 Tax=Brassica cretica TaxID=69181 RepID=A0A8S9N998_BRACR|nr:hypothetical protein F2Q69_00053920 [Brassica cretica]
MRIKEALPGGDQRALRGACCYYIFNNRFFLPVAELFLESISSDLGFSGDTLAEGGTLCISSFEWMSDLFELRFTL